MRIPFSVRIISSIVIIELIILSLMVWNNVRIINQSYTDFLQTASRDQSALLASAIAPGLLAYDLALIEDALTVIKEKHDLIFAEVFDLNSRKIAAIGNYPQRKAFSLSEKYNEVIEDDIITIYQVITIEDQIVGGLRVGFSTEVLRHTIDEIRWHSLLISFAALLLIIVVTVLISLVLTRKLNKIQEGVVQIQQGNLAHRIQVPRNDELGDLAYTFNDMAQHLNEVQQQLISEQSELERRVNDRTIELKASNDSLKNTLDDLNKTQSQLIETEKMASLGGIVAGVAHEINTPLGISITAISSIQDELRALKNDFESDQMSQESFKNYIEKTEHYSSMLYGNLKTSAELINSFKQVAVNNTTTDWRTINMYSYINEIISSQEQLLSEHQVSIENFCNDRLDIYTSPGAIYQVINTLISNSVTHAFEKKANGQIIIYAEQDKNKITIEYQDNGKGIMNEHKHLIFEPFFTTRRGSRENSGLGLSIIYNLISNTLKGQIKVDSKVDEGTTFQIILPVLSEQNHLL